MTDINSKLFFLVEKKKQEKLKELELKNNPEVVEEEISEGVKTVRIMAEAKKEEPIEVIRDLSDEEVLARMAAEEEPSIIDKIKDTLITRNAEATAPAIEAEAPEAGSTEAVIISQSDSKITKQIDSTKTYSVELQKLNGGTVTYIINSDESQQISLNWVLEEGKERLVVNGNGIRVTVPSDDYSNVVIGGNQNKILVDGTTKSYESTGSISFESYKGGSAVTRWGGEAPEPVNYADSVELSRSVFSNVHTLNVYKDAPVLVTLKDPFTGEPRKYSITSLDEDKQIALNYLNVDRLVITGSHVKVEAWDLNEGDTKEQNDDLILIGSYNEVYTGKGADAVRVGDVTDDPNNKYNMTATNGGVLYDTVLNKKYYLSIGNKLNTGDGDDYVTMNGKTYDVDLGEGTDKFIYKNSSLGASELAKGDEYDVSPNSTDRTVKNSSYIAYEQSDNKDNIFINESEMTSDGILGWTRKVAKGNCQFFSFLTCLTQKDQSGNVQNAHNNNLNLSDYGISIITSCSPEGTITGYSVVFDRYTFGNNIASVSSQELSDCECGLYGDIDARIVTLAMKKLMAENENETKDDMYEPRFKGIWAKYFYGNTDYIYNTSTITSGKDGAVSNNTLYMFWKLYEAGKIDNLAIAVKNNLTGTDIYDESVSGHAYAVKNVVYDADENMQYIELQSPWDTNDSIKFNLSEYMDNKNCFERLEIIGYSYEQCLAMYNDLVANS